MSVRIRAFGAVFQNFAIRGIDAYLTGRTSVGSDVEREAESAPTCLRLEFPVGDGARLRLEGNRLGLCISNPCLGWRIAGRNRRGRWSQLPLSWQCRQSPRRYTDERRLLDDNVSYLVAPRSGRHSRHNRDYRIERKRRTILQAALSRDGSGCIKGSC